MYTHKTLLWCEEVLGAPQPCQFMHLFSDGRIPIIFNRQTIHDLDVIWRLYLCRYIKILNEHFYVHLLHIYFVSYRKSSNSSKGADKKPKLQIDLTWVLTISIVRYLWWPILVGFVLKVTVVRAVGFQKVRRVSSLDCKKRILKLFLIIDDLRIRENYPAL